MKTNQLNLCIFFVVIISSLFSCKPQASCEPSNEEKIKITSEVEKVVKDLWNPSTVSYETNDILRRGIDGYAMGSDGKIVFKNYEEFDKAMKASFGNLKRFIDSEVPLIHVYVLSKNAAACTYEFKSRFISNSNDTIINNGCWTFVLKRFENGWKVVQENGTHTQN